jgi:very-short-patch-repair endonuclease
VAPEPFAGGGVHDNAALADSQSDNAGARGICGRWRRWRQLRRLGYRVLRLDAELVMRELPAALARVRDALAWHGERKVG